MARISVLVGMVSSRSRPAPLPHRVVVGGGAGGVPAGGCGTFAAPAPGGRPAIGIWLPAAYMHCMYAMS